MGRKPRTIPKGTDRSQLNATLPEQLVIDFNSYCVDQKIERRDDLMEYVLRRFLHSPRKPAKRVTPATLIDKSNVDQFTQAEGAA